MARLRSPKVHPHKMTVPQHLCHTYSRFLLSGRSSVRFATYEFVGAQLQGDGQKLSPLQAMLAGTIAGGSE